LTLIGQACAELRRSVILRYILDTYERNFVSWSACVPVVDALQYTCIRFQLLTI